MALKRINTEEEENGFPITAIREVKILKALNHPNVVQLKEIVTSKGKNWSRLTSVADYFHGDSSFDSKECVQLYSTILILLDIISEVLCEWFLLSKNCLVTYNYI